MPRLNPEALTFGTFTSSNPPVEQVLAAARGLEAAGFDHVWSGDQLQYQHPHSLWRPDLCDGATVAPKLAAKFALQPLMSVLGQHNYLAVWNLKRLQDRFKKEPFSDEDGRLLAEYGI